MIGEAERHCVTSGHDEFVAFSRDLAEGGGKSVSIASYDTPEKKLPDTAIKASHPVIWKLRIVWAIDALKQALGAGTLDELDAGWDSCRRKLNYRLAEHAESKDLAVRDAAQRLRALLLQGNGTAQTRLKSPRRLPCAPSPGPLKR